MTSRSDQPRNGIAGRPQSGAAAAHVERLNRSEVQRAFLQLQRGSDYTLRCLQR
jgi:hypothetical protein